MSRLRFACAALGIALSGCASPPKSRSYSIFSETDRVAVFKEDIGWPGAEAQRIEFFWAKPLSGKGPWPTLVFLHGHQAPQRPGGRDYVYTGLVRKFALQGALAVAVSLPGYGGSEGPPDYGGPRSRQSVRHVLEHLSKLGFVQADRVVAWGINRGGIVAGMMAARDQDVPLSGAILISTPLDLSRVYEGLKSSGEDRDAKLAADLEAEVSPGDEAFRERSIMAYAQSVRAPLLLLAGGKDRSSDPANAAEFARIVNSSGGRAEAHVFEPYESYIPSDFRNAKAFPFLDRALFGR